MPTLEEIMASSPRKEGLSLSAITGATPTTPYRTAGGGDIAPPGPALTKGEKIDVALQAIPATLATVATLPISGPGALATGAATGFAALARAVGIRALVATGAGAQGSLLKSGLQTALDTPGKPQGKADVINRALEDSVMSGGPELLFGLLGAVPGAVVSAGRKAAQYAPKSTGGQRYYKAKWDEAKKAADAMREAKDEAAATTIQAFNSAVEPHEIGEIMQSGYRKFLDNFKAEERKQYSAFEQAMADTKIDYRDVADRVIKIESERPKAKGGLKVVTDPDSEWAKLVESMREGQKAKVIPISEGVPRKVGPLGEELAPAQPKSWKVGTAPNAMERGDAVIKARSAISQRLHDIDSGLAEGYTKEYVEGLRDLLKSLDGKIKTAAYQKDPLLGAGYEELLKFSGSHREVLKQSFMNMARDRKGDLAKTLLSSSRPEWVDTFKLMVKEGAITPDDFGKVQRSAVESLLLRTKGTGEKVMDIENFASRLDATGAAGRRLFGDEAAQRTVNNLREMSVELKKLPKTPAAAGIPYVGEPENKLMELLASAVGYKITNIVFLPREGYAQMNKYLTAIASDPKAYPKLVGAIKAAQKVGVYAPSAASLAADAVRIAGVAEGLRPLFQPQMAPAH